MSKHRHQTGRIDANTQDQGASLTFGMDPESRDRMRQHLEEAERHVEQGRQHLRKQCEVIDRLQRDGHDPSSARKLLHALEQTQIMHIADRDRIREQLTRAPADVRGSASTL